MTANALNVKAAIAAGLGAGLSLAWLGPQGTTLPTTPTAALNAAFLDGGLCNQSGLEEDDAVSTTPVPAFGTLSPVRKLITEEDLTFKITFLETNPVSLAAYFRKALGSITPATGTGVFGITQGQPARQLYAGVFDMLDGADHERIVCPNIELTDKDALVHSPLGVTQYGCTFTAYPDSSGVSVYRWYQIASLG